MIDFNLMNEVLKVDWIPHLQTRSDASWKIVPEATLEILAERHSLIFTMQLRR